MIGVLLAKGIADLSFGGALLWYVVKYIVSAALAVAAVMLGIRLRKNKNAKTEQLAVEMEQGYLCTDPVVRIRRSNDKYILTCKSFDGMIGERRADVRMCQEYEINLSEESYKHLRQKVDGGLISKTRYIIPLADGHIAELDVFHGPLEGLRFVEVEFQDEEDADLFVPPEWFGQNVSGDKRYSNSFLSTQTGLEAVL